MYRSLGQTSQIDVWKNAEAGRYSHWAQANAARYDTLPVAFDGRIQGSVVKCLPDQFFPQRWWKKGYVFTDSGKDIHWKDYARGDIENLCDCINNPGIPDVVSAVFQFGRATLTEEQMRSYVAQAFGYNNSQERVDFCWTRYLQRYSAANMSTTKGGWISTPREPQEVKDSAPPLLKITERVRNFPNPCKPHHHIPPSCSAVRMFSNADAIQRGHVPVTAVERQPVELSWIFGAYQNNDPSAAKLSATRDSFKPGANYFPQEPIRNAYGVIRELNKVRNNIRIASKQSMSGVSTNSAIALSAVGVTTVALGGLIYLMTRKKR